MAKKKAAAADKPEPKIKVCLKVVIECDVVVEMTKAQLDDLEENMPCYEDGLPGGMEIDLGSALDGVTGIEISDAVVIKAPKGKVGT